MAPISIIFLHHGYSNRSPVGQQKRHQVDLLLWQKRELTLSKKKDIKEMGVPVHGHLRSCLRAPNTWAHFCFGIARSGASDFMKYPLAFRSPPLRCFALPNSFGLLSSSRLRLSFLQTFSNQILLGIY